MSQQVIICKGLPGSGKSTWARIYCEKNPDYVRVNRDDLRRMRGKYWLPKDEDMITDWEQSSVIQALSRGKNVIIDSTNLNPKYLKQFKRLIESFEEHEHVEIIEKTFDLSPEECIKRDATRGNESVGAEIIWEMYYKYIAPVPQYKEDPNLPHCIIVDVDGTLALNKNGRSPYDYDRVHEDAINIPVRDVVYDYVSNSVHGERYVFIVSGRDDNCLDITKQWLKNKRVYFDGIYMRTTGDKRKDSIVKRELFEQHIKGKFYVDYVLDDRDQVVRMWRKELGLTCLQAAYGNF